MKKIYYLFIAVGLLTGLGTQAQDAAAKKILDNVSAKLKSYKGITGTFNLVSKSRAGKVNQTGTGKIVIKGNQYYIHQGAMEIFSNGDKTWNYNGKDEVMVTAADADEQALTPQKLLTNFYDEDFSYKLVSSAGSYYEIQLVPNDKRKNFQRINIFVNKAKMMITKARVLDKGSNTIEFSLSNINTNASIPESTFVFNKAKYNKPIEVIE